MLSTALPQLKNSVKNCVEKAVYDGVYDAIMASFGTDSSESAGDADANKKQKDAAKKAADAAKKTISNELVGDLCSAIDKYVKAIGIQITAPQTTLVSPTGPVTGVVMISPAQVNIL